MRFSEAAPRLCLSVALSILLLGMSGQAVEAALEFSLGNQPFGTPPYAELDITASTITGQVTFDVQTTSAYSGYKMLGFGFNSLADITGFTLASIPLPSWTVISAGAQQDGFGNFDWVIDASNSSGSNRVTDAFSITLQLTDFSKATVANFLKASDNNTGPALFVTHFYPVSGDTGFIAVPAAAVPEATAFLVWGLIGLACIPALMRFRTFSST